MGNPPRVLGSPLTGAGPEPCQLLHAKFLPGEVGHPAQALSLLPAHLLEPPSGEGHSPLPGLWPPRPLPRYSSMRGRPQAPSHLEDFGGPGRQRLQGARCGDGADAAAQQGRSGRQGPLAVGRGGSRFGRGRVLGRGSGPVHIRATLGGRGAGGRGGGAWGRRRGQSAPRSHRCKQEHNGASGGRAAAKLGASAARLTGRPANGRRRAALGSQWARCGGGPERG